jgi:hypothetical protein
MSFTRISWIRRSVLYSYCIVIAIAFYHSRNVLTAAPLRVPTYMTLKHKAPMPVLMRWRIALYAEVDPSPDCPGLGLACIELLSGGKHL